MENHDFTSQVERLLEIVRAVQSPWFGINFDSGNFRSEDPYADISNRDTVVRRYPNESFCSTLRCIKSRRSHMSELLNYHHSIHSNKHKAKI